MRRVCWLSAMLAGYSPGGFVIARSETTKQSSFLASRPGLLLTLAMTRLALVAPTYFDAYLVGRFDLRFDARSAARFNFNFFARLARLRRVSAALRAARRRRSLRLRMHATH